MSIEKEIEKIEKEKQKLDQLKAELLKTVEEQENERRGIQSMIEQGGFGSPQRLADKLVELFGVKVTQAERNGSRRSRTTITPAIRDGVKAALSQGERRRDVAEQFEVSYQTVLNIGRGRYDHL
ncbi:MAG: hypothetical protein ACFCU4_10535 [Puniceicoccaceae bacterium]